MSVVFGLTVIDPSGAEGPEDRAGKAGDADGSEGEEATCGTEEGRDLLSEVEEAAEEAQVGQKRKLLSSGAADASGPTAAKSAKKTPARPSSSTPAPTPSKSKKPKGVLNIEELVKSEELTRQKELELAHAQVRLRSARLEAKKTLQLQREKQQFELRMMQLQVRKDLAVEQMRLRFQQGSNQRKFFATPSSMSSSTASSRAPSLGPSAFESSSTQSPSLPGFDTSFTDYSSMLSSDQMGTGAEGGQMGLGLLSELEDLASVMPSQPVASGSSSVVEGDPLQ